MNKPNKSEFAFDHAQKQLSELNHFGSQCKFLVFHLGCMFFGKSNPERILTFMKKRVPKSQYIVLTCNKI